MSVRAGFTGYRKRKDPHAGKVYRLIRKPIAPTLIKVDGRDYRADISVSIVECFPDGSYRERWHFFTEGGALAWARANHVTIEEAPHEAQ